MARWTDRQRDDGYVLALVVACFLPWIAACAVLALLCVLLWVLPRTRRALLADKAALWRCSPWLLLATVPAALWRNWLGLLAGGGVLCFFSLFLWLRQVMNTDRTVLALRTATLCGIPVAIYAMVQKILFVCFDFPATEPMILPSNDDLRCPSTFGNPNEYAAVASVLVLVALWLFWEGKVRLPVTALTVTASLVGLFLTASLMGMLGLFGGLVVLTLLKKRWWEFGVLLGGVSLCFLLLAVVPDVLPHAAGAGHSFALRIQIWKLFPYLFREAPLFGRGFLSYNAFHADWIGADLGFAVRRTNNAHNLLLDGLLNYGVVGVGLVGWYLVRVAKAAVARRHTVGCPVALAFAVLFGAAVHGVFDVAAAWPQVAVLLVLVLSAATCVNTPGISKQGGNNHESDRI